MGWWQRYLDWRHRYIAAIELRSGAFRIRAGQSSRQASWNAIRRVTAYKRDLMTVDLFCLLLELDDGVLEVHEDMIGYPVFEQALFEVLGLDSEWKLNVLFPAFEAKPTLIYQRTST